WTNDKRGGARFYSPTCGQLASINDDLAHVGLSVIRLERRGPSRHQHHPAYHCSAPAVYGAAENNRCSVEECNCRGIICDPPASCRISSMGKREKRCAQRCVLHAHIMGICALCGCSINRALSYRGSHIR